MRIELGVPQAKQVEFLTAKERYVAYGGARGGGKSWAVRYKAAVLALKHSGIKILIMRRTYAELDSNHIAPLRAVLQEAAVYNDTKKVLRLRNGSLIMFGYCASAKDIDRYQGQEYDVIFLDEATQFAEEVFNALKVCIRGVNDFPKRFYLTCNPGGVGHEWVKRLFIARDYLPAEDPGDYRFIKATVFDNERLLRQDPEYVAVLESLPEQKRRAWLDGDWDSFQGQFFTEFDRGVHVCKEFALGGQCLRFAAVDYGLDMLAVVFVAVDRDGRAWVYDEIHKPNLTIAQACEAMKAKAAGVKFFYAPRDLWGRSQETGRSRADIFAENGVCLVKCDVNRLSGWQAVHEWLKTMRNEIGQEVAKLTIMANCVNLIRCLPAVQHDEDNIDDVASEPHELTHIVDALRYFCVSRPLVPQAERVPRWMKDREDYDDMDEIELFLEYGG